MKDTIQKLLNLFNKREKKKLIYLLIMMVIAAVFETIGIGLVAPFVGLVTNPEIIQEQTILSTIYKFLNFQSASSFILFSVIVLLTIFVLKNVYLLFFNYAQYSIILNQQAKLSRNLYEKYLTKPYIFHLQRNSAVLLRNINKEVPRVFQGIIISGLQLVTEMLVITFILGLLLVTAPTATITAAIILSGSVILFFKFFRTKMGNLGKEKQKVSGAMIKWVNQGLGATKEVKVFGKEKFFVNAYSKQTKIMASNNRYIKMLEETPRFFIETLLVGIVLITMLIIITQGTNTTQLVSTMSLFTMAAFRLMPSINRVVTMITTIRHSRSALSVVYEDLFDNKEEDSNKVTSSIEPIKVHQNKKTFNDSLKLQEVSFCYPNQKEYAVQDVSLSIPIGHSVAFIGESGAGKTTLVDIILGLLHPDKGNILIDDKNMHGQKALWRQKIGYIPQFIYLSDDTIRGNVAFGRESDDIDDNRVWRALEQAQLKGFVKGLPEKLKTNVGERGVRLSGGQRQRIGIARALYHDPEIIFMDEATSALDNETEKEIMTAIDGLKGDKTLIIIAHRLTTIEKCDITFNISNGRLSIVKNKLENSVI